jgi:hypothetical protein
MVDACPALPWQTKTCNLAPRCRKLDRSLTAQLAIMGYGLAYHDNSSLAGAVRSLRFAVRSRCPTLPAGRRCAARVPGNGSYDCSEDASPDSRKDLKHPEANHPGTNHTHGRPLCMNDKQEMSKGERETGPLTKPILNPLQVLWKDFAKGGQDCCWESVRAVRFGRATRLSGPHPRSELRVYNQLPTVPAPPHFGGVSPGAD